MKTAFSGVEALNLSYSIGSNLILNGLHFQLPQGQILGVLGPNGAGKTSLLRLIAGQPIETKEAVINGGVHWQGQAISKLSLSEKAKQIAMLNQHETPVFGLTLEQVVEMGRLAHQSLLHKRSQSDRDKVTEALIKVGLEEKMHNPFNTLSGGEQQRGLIARALVQKAVLLVLDEPVNHLDVYYQHQVLQLIRHLGDELGLTAVVSLHDVNLANHYCDRICLLSNGNQVGFGSPNEVLTPARLEEVYGLPCQSIVALDAESHHFIFSAQTHGDKSVSD